MKYCRSSFHSLVVTTNDYPNDEEHEKPEMNARFHIVSGRAFSVALQGALQVENRAAPA